MSSAQTGLIVKIDLEPERRPFCFCSMDAFDRKIFYKLVVRSTLLAVMCGAIGATITRVLTGGIMLGVGIMVAVPLALVYGVANGIVLGLLLAHQHTRIVVAGEDSPDQIRSRKWLFVLISIPVTGIVTALVFLMPSRGDWFDEVKFCLAFGVPAVIVSCLVATIKLVNWYVQYRSELAQVVTTLPSGERNVWPPAPLSNDDARNGVAALNPEYGDANGPFLDSK